MLRMLTVDRLKRRAVEAVGGTATEDPFESAAFVVDSISAAIPDDIPAAEVAGDAELAQAIVASVEAPA